MALGWSKDEFEAVGASMAGRGRLADEFISVLKAIWTSDPVEFHGDIYNIPKSNILPKPVQKPHPPIYLAAFSPGGLKRTAMMANGWLLAGTPLDALRQMIPGLKEMTREAGRDPAEVQVILRANLEVTPEPLSGQRFNCTGSLEQIREDIAANRELGVDELHFDPSFSPDGTSLDGFLKTMEQMKRLAET